MLRHRRLWTLALAVGLAELTLLLVVLAALALANGGLVITIGPRRGAAGEMLIPVSGVRREDLRDSFGDPRSGGRRHQGIDIFAREGTPVVAPADAVVVERRTSRSGGISLYLRDLEGVTVFYYAHLRGYRPGLREGHLVRRGDVLGYVGRTGNVQGSAHLHFAVYTVEDPNRWWSGRHVNPYRLLRDAGAH